MLLNWKKELETGIEEIDRQHRSLFETANKLYEAKSMGESALEKQMGLIIDELIAYAEEHFLAEEELMRLCEYKGLTKHKKSHQNFHDEILRTKEQLRKRKPDLFMALEIYNYLIDWMLEHISKVDREYLPCVKGLERHD